MFKRLPKLTQLHRFLVLGILSILAGCGGGGDSGTEPPPVPAMPTNLVATAGDASVSLTWSASSGAATYRVKRATTSGGPYTQVGSPGSTSYNDSSLTNGTIYYYVVSAINTTGESSNSTQASATPVAPVAVPAAPTGLTATPANAQVTLNWTASAGATS
jgi:cellulose 1,4-beta-cellobiosidase